jgi:hypothetical protein
LQDGGPMAVRHGHYPAVMSTSAVLIGTKERRSMATLLLGAVGLIAAFWAAWYTDRSVMASQTSVRYDLEDGVWSNGANGIVALIINVLTLGLSLFVLRRTWVHHELLEP